jgi:MEMO1 family protein
MSKWFILVMLVVATGCRDQSAKLPADAAANAAPPKSDVPTRSSLAPGNGPAELDVVVASAAPAPTAETDPADAALVAAGTDPATTAKADPGEAPQMKFSPRTVIPPRATTTSDGHQIPAPATSTVRPAALAGAWYDGDAATLRTATSELLAKAPAADYTGYPIALLVPHAGHRFSGAIAARAYATLKGRTYGRVFILGPAHRTALKGIAFPTGITHFETPLGQIPLAVDVIEELRKEPLFVDHPSAHRTEHSIEIHLPFLQLVLPHGFQLVPMVVSGLNRAEIDAAAAALRRVIRPGDLLIASSDFTHYGERFDYLGPAGKEFGPAAAKVRLQGLLDSAWLTIEKLDATAFLRHKVETRDTICGFLPIALLLKTLPADSTPHLLGTDMSGNMTGSFAESVSYLSAVFSAIWPYSSVSGAAQLSAEEKKVLLDLACQQVDTYVQSQERLQESSLKVALTPRLKAESGTFVTLKQNGRLRGCIGNIMPVKPLFQAVLDNAVNAAHFDRRFKPVQPEELPQTSVEVSVLTPPVARNDWRDLVLGRDGIILSKPGGSAVFLPQVAVEQGWTLEETLAHLSSKAGLGRDGWRDGATYQTFEAIVFHQDP